MSPAILLQSQLYKAFSFFSAILLIICGMCTASSILLINRVLRRRGRGGERRGERGGG